MTVLKDVKFGFGQVTYNKEIEPIPPTNKREGNVTINTVGSPGKPGYYLVTYMISCELERAGIDLNNIFHWSVVIEDSKKEASYISVESEAARQIAPMLRAVAQKIEELVNDFDTKRSEVVSANN